MTLPKIFLLKIKVILKNKNKKKELEGRLTGGRPLKRSGRWQYIAEIYLPGICCALLPWRRVLTVKFLWANGFSLIVPNRIHVSEHIRDAGKIIHRRLGHKEFYSNIHAVFAERWGMPMPSRHHHLAFLQKTIPMSYVHVHNMILLRKNKQ
jgi:hypothetical protein